MELHPPSLFLTGQEEPATLTAEGNMPFKYNPFTNNLDFFEANTGGGGDVVGPASSTAGYFAIFADNTGKLLAERASPLAVEFGGTGQVTLTNHGVLLGQSTSPVGSTLAGTAGQVLQSGGASADPTYSTAIYPSTSGSNGNLITSDGTDFVSSALIAGTGVSIANGVGTVTISSSGGGLTWTVVAGTTQAMAVNNGYIANNAGVVTATLPATSAVGDIVAITGINNATGWKIAQNAGNTIFFGTATTTPGVGGSLQSSATRDAITLVCVSANANWQALSSVGNITVV